MITPPSIYAPGYIHAGTFARRSGVLTDASIKAKQTELNDNGYIAELRRRAVLEAVSDDPTVASVCRIVNPARSGIWNANQTLNHERLAELKGRCIKIEGALLVTRSIFQAFIDERRATIKKSPLPDVLALGTVTWVSPSSACPYMKVLPIPFTAVTDGSLDAFFHTYSDRTHHGDSNSRLKFFA
jgi:hypothetical protein